MKEEYQKEKKKNCDEGVDQLIWFNEFTILFYKKNCAQII